MRSKGKTLNQQVWAKEVKRISRLINKLSPPDFELIKSRIIPEKPKRITKNAIRKIQSVDLLSIREALDKPQLSKVRKHKQEDLPTPRRRGGIPEADVVTGIRRKPVYSEKQKEQMRERLAKARAKRVWTDEDRERARQNLAKARANRKWTEADKEKARKNLAKAREAMRKRMEEDEDYAKKIREIRLKNLEKAREAKKGKRTTPSPKVPTPTKPVPPTKAPTKDTPRPDEPTEADTMTDVIISTLNSGVNENVAQYLTNVFYDQLSEDEEGTLQRINEQPDYIKDIANRVAWDSDPNDLKGDAVSMYFLITGEQPSSYIEDYLMTLAFSDRGYKRRRKSK